MGRKPRETPRPKLTLQVEPEHVERLKQIALRSGYITPAGPHAGEGSISAMMSAIAILPPVRQDKLVELIQPSIDDAMDAIDKLSPAQRKKLLEHLKKTDLTETAEES